MIPRCDFSYDLLIFLLNRRLKLSPFKLLLRLLIPNLCMLKPRLGDSDSASANHFGYLFLQAAMIVVQGLLMAEFRS